MHNHIVFIVMDSCRYDTLVAASTPNIDRIGQAQKRYSDASWTAPANTHFIVTADHGELSAKTVISDTVRSCTRSASRSHTWKAGRKQRRPSDRAVHSEAMFFFGERRNAN